MKLAELMRQIQDASGSEPDMMALKEKCDALGIHLESIYQELEMNSAYAESHRDINYEPGLVRLHSHSFYEMIYCTSCDNIQYLVGTERYRLQRGDIIWIPPGVSHCPLFPAAMKTPYERIVLWVNAEKMAAFFDRWLELDFQHNTRRLHYLLRTAGTAQERELREAFQRGCRESETRQPGWEAALYSNTNLILIHLIRAMGGKEEQPMREKTELLDELLAFVFRASAGADHRPGYRPDAPCQRKYRDPPLQQTPGVELLPLRHPAAAGPGQTADARIRRSEQCGRKGRILRLYRLLPGL